MKLEITMGLDSLVPDLWNGLVAPKITAFRDPSIPDLSAKRENFVDVFVLNLDLNLVLSNKMRRALFNLARKTQDAMDEYCEGRAWALRHIAGGYRTTANYLCAVRHFEQCLTHVREAIDCANLITSDKQFVANDGSALDRATLIRGATHHMARKFADSTAADETTFQLFLNRSCGGARTSTSDATMANIPMWLTNEGLESASAALSYSELSKELCAFADDVDRMIRMTPAKKTTLHSGQ